MSPQTSETAHLRVAAADSCPQMPSPKHVSSSSQDRLTAPEEAAAVAELPQFTGQPININCRSFWFSLTSQAVICGSSNCVGKQLLTNNRSQGKADIKETVYATSWWIRLWNGSGQILIFDQVKSVPCSDSLALAWNIQRAHWATSKEMKILN